MMDYQCECGYHAIALEHEPSGRMYWACPRGLCTTGKEGYQLKMLSWEQAREVRQYIKENMYQSESKY